MDMSIVEAINAEIDKLLEQNEIRLKTPESFMRADSEQSPEEFRMFLFHLDNAMRSLQRWVDSAQQPTVRFALHALVGLVKITAAIDADAETSRRTRRLGAKKAADARHAENRAMAQELFEWFRENGMNFRSLDEAAEAAGKVVPMKFRARRKHIGEAARKLRSTRKE